MNNLGTKRLITERLILKKFTDNDAKDMFTNWSSDSLRNLYIYYIRKGKIIYMIGGKYEYIICIRFRWDPSEC